MAPAPINADAVIASLPSLDLETATRTAPAADADGATPDAVSAARVTAMAATAATVVSASAMAATEQAEGDNAAADSALAPMSSRPPPACRKMATRHPAAATSTQRLPRHRQIPRRLRWPMGQQLLRLWPGRGTGCRSASCSRSGSSSPRSV
ncbi:hypothetical protein [Comamonas sp. JC664]|uniref:hypothetical protein n=1 Tax=Comamonas sp. JC664 TaxID=2801917 RepID=UPI00361EC39F